MSKQKNKNTLLAGHSRTSISSSIKDEILAMKYVMEKPEAPIYALDDKLPEKSYPDYGPWDDQHDLKDKLNNPNYLNKGYFESPLVSNEYYSARNLIQETLFSSSKNCTYILKELSQHFTKAYKTRNEVINKFRANTNNFRIPPRVTLTALKKEAWLKDLANPEVPLQHVSTKLPHGIRNKILVDNMCSKNVPMTRAIWFTKCSLYSELLLLRRKVQSKQSSLSLSLIPPTDAFESRWLQEWTQQVADYVYKFSREMVNITTPEKKLQFNAKLSYLFTYVQTLYVECLLDRVFFLSSIMKFLREDLPFDPAQIPTLLELSRAETDEEQAVLGRLLGGKHINYGQILVALSLVKMFWRDILQEDILCKFLSESLLLNYFLIERIPTHSTKLGSGVLPPALKLDILVLLSTLVTHLFKHNTNVFIVPTYWMLIGDVLFKILIKEENVLIEMEQEKLQKVLQLINYRNESLMLNMKYLYQERTPDSVVSRGARRSSFLNAEFPSLARSISKPMDAEERDHTYISRASDDNLKIIEQLDKLKLNNNLTALLKPKASTIEFDGWKVKLSVLVFWCVSSYREMGTSKEKILIICNYLKRKVLQALTTRGSARLKAEFENQLLESIFALAQEPTESVCMYNLYVLINELYQLKIITISSYLRKLIACGIFYMPPQDGGIISMQAKDPIVAFHLAILQNLPLLNNKQCDHILKKWTSDKLNYAECFATGSEILKTEILDRLLNNSFDSRFDKSLDYIKSLNVGTKFLLVNWLTSQIKATISKSPKLIHITPSIIAKVYQFYALSDNLTVFFKVFVKFVLKNENRVIIFYLESLHFISKLIVQHYSLVKFIAGNSYEAISTAYELFKLVIISYKDLLTRETDLYRFHEVWKFINMSVKKSFSSDDNRNHDIEGKNGLNKLLYEKEVADSPLKILTHGTRQNDNYSADSFKEDLDILLLNDGNLMSTEELEETFQDLKDIQHRLRPDMFGDPKSVENSVQSLLEFFYNKSSLLSQNQEIVVFKLFETSRRQLKSVNSTSFRDSIRDFSVKILSDSEDTRRLTLFFIKLLCFEVFHIFELLAMFRDLQGSFPDDRLDTMTINILCASNEEDLFNYQVLTLRAMQTDYRAKHFADLFVFMVEKLKQSLDLNSSFIVVNYNDEVLKVIRQMLIDNPKWATDHLFSELSATKILALCSLLFPRHVDSIEDVGLVAALTNEFNLPIVQTILRLVTANQLEDDDKLQSMVRLILGNLHFLFGPVNSFFGEIFNYLDWNSKLRIFNYLETLVLTQTQFYTGWNLESAMIDEDIHYVSLKETNDGVELLPVLKDYFKKFSVSFVEKIDTSEELFQNLSSFLVKLLLLLDSEVVEQLEDKNVYNIVSVFLRLLIIHKVSLTTAISMNDGVHFSFIKNLVLLLNSRYLTCGHEKLRILLYDLLHLMKSSLTLALSVSAEEELMGTSPAGHPQTIIEEKPEGDIAAYNGSASLAIMLSILNLPEPNTTNPFQEGTEKEISCALMLDEDELHNDSDVSIVNNSNFILTSSRRDSIPFSPFAGVAHQAEPSGPFTIKSFKLIEDTSGALNEGCINLSMFDAYTTKENPL